MVRLTYLVEMVDDALEGFKIPHCPSSSLIHEPKANPEAPQNVKGPCTVLKSWEHTDTTGELSFTRTCVGEVSMRRAWLDVVRHALKRNTLGLTATYSHNKLVAKRTDAACVMQTTHKHPVIL